MSGKVMDMTPVREQRGVQPERLQLFQETLLPFLATYLAQT